VVSELGPARRPVSDWPPVGSFSYLAKENHWEWSDSVAAMHDYEPGKVNPTTELILSHQAP
jgi:hypothetical protein